MSSLQLLARKLGSRVALDAGDMAAIMAIPFVTRTYEAASYLIREGEPPRRYCSFIASGFAFRQKLTVQGARQIVSLHMTGDLLDLQHLFLRQADHNVQALTRLNAIELDRDALRALATERPNIAEALWVEALIDASIYREWVVNVGRRDARSRIAHLLCEFATRMEAMGLATDGRYELPMTQEQMGDATGLTSVHVNRTLKALTNEGLLERDKRHISFSDWDGLSEVAEFSALYLHLDQSTVRQ